MGARDRGETVAPGWRRCVVLLIAAGTLLLPVILVASAAADGDYQVSLEYTVESGAYNNSVRAGSVANLLYPRIAVDRNPQSPFRGTVYVVGFHVVGNESCFAPSVVRSTDGGRNFTAPTVSSLCSPSPYLDVAVGRSGTLYAATWGPRILRSVDQGDTWQLLATVGNATSPASLAVDPVTGGLFVTWSSAAVPFSRSTGPVFVSSSWDGGTTWLTPTAVLPNGTTGASPQIAPFGETVIVGLIATAGADPYIAASVSHDGGITFGSPVALSPSAPCMWSSAPSAAVSSGGVFAVSWYADPAYTGTLCWHNEGNTTETLVSVSTDGGATFSAPRRMGGPPGWPTVGFGDALAFDDHARLYVTWHSLDPEMWSGTVYVANSTSLGLDAEQASFSTRLQVSGGNSTAQENLATGLNDTVYLVWVSFDSAGDPYGSSDGVFVRAVTGEATATLQLPSPAPSPSAELELRDAATGTVQLHAVWQGAALTIPGIVPSEYEVSVQLGNRSYMAGRIPVPTWGRTVFTVYVEATSPPPGHEPPPGGPPFPWDLVAFFGGGLVAATAALNSVHHLRLAREDVLQRKVRALMFEHIRDHPGVSFTEVRDAVGLQNGVAAYHLQILERLGFVHSESRRRRRWYYPNGDVSLWRDLPLSPLQASIVREIRRSPGIGIRELARTVNRRPSSVGYNVKALAREGLLRMERKGRKVCCFAPEGGCPA